MNQYRRIVVPRVFALLNVLVLCVVPIASCTAGPSGPLARTHPARDHDPRPALDIGWVVRDFDGEPLATETSLPLRFDAIILYQRELGLYLDGGPHTMVENPGWLARHLREVEQDVEEHVPAGFDGLVCIDYEKWGTIAKNPVDVDRMIIALSSNAPEFTDLPRQRQVEIAEATYHNRARTFYIETLRVCQEARPRAKWGFWNRPLRGTMGLLSSRADEIRTRNNQLDWMMDAVDVVYPSIYPRLYLIDESEEPRSSRHVTPSRLYDIQRSIIEESVRLARGKPVYPYMSMRSYPRVGGKATPGEMLTVAHMAATVRAAIDAGANGIIIWGGKGDERLARNFQEHVLRPVMERFDLLPATTDALGPPSGESPPQDSRSRTGAESQGR